MQLLRRPTAVLALAVVLAGFARAAEDPRLAGSSRGARNGCMFPEGYPH